MNRLTENDMNFGPITVARWKNRFGIELSSGDDEDPGNFFRVVAFGWVLQVKLPRILKPAGKYGEHRRSYGLCLSDMGGGYDFFQLSYGQQIGDIISRRRWAHII
jgi:hypothetical protein